MSTNPETSYWKRDLKIKPAGTSIVPGRQQREIYNTTCPLRYPVTGKRFRIIREVFLLKILFLNVAFLKI